MPTFQEGSRQVLEATKQEATKVRSLKKVHGRSWKQEPERTLEKPKRFTADLKNPQ